VANTPQTDITAIANYAGKYETKIITQIVNSLDVAKDLTVRRNLTAPVNLPKFSATDGFRPVDTSIEEPDGQSGIFGIRQLIPRVGMKILKIVPEDLRGTYLSDILDPNAKEYPAGFAEYFWEAQIKKLAQEINNNSYFGVDSFDIIAFNAGTAYNIGDRFSYNKSFYQVITATTAGQTPDTNAAKFKKINNASVAKGLGTIIASEYAGLPARNKITTGALDTANAFDKVVAFYMSLPEEIRPVGGTVYCSQSTYDKYSQATLAKFPNGINDLKVPGMVGSGIFGSDGKWNLKPCTWMSGSGRLIGTLAGNLLMGTNQLSDFSSIGNIVPFLHGYRAIMKMVLAFQIADLEVLFVNDQA
jgi:hypothetical protein